MKHIIIFIFTTSLLFSYGKTYIQSFEIKGFKSADHALLKTKLKTLLKKHRGCNTMRNRDRSNTTKLAVICNMKSKTYLNRAYIQIKRKMKFKVTKGRLVTKSI